MRCRNKANSMRVVLRFTVGLILGLFVLGIGNIQYVEGSSWHKGRFHKAESLTCGETITTHAVLYNDLDCSNFGGVALTLGDGADLNLHGKKIIGNESDNCIEITGDGAKVWNGTVMKCFYGIEVTGNRNEITQVEVRDNKRIGINIAGNSNKIYSSIVDNNGRQDRQDQTQTIVQRPAQARAAVKASGPQGRRRPQLADPCITPIKSTQIGGLTISGDCHFCCKRPGDLGISG